MRPELLHREAVGLEQTMRSSLESQLGTVARRPPFAAAVAAAMLWGMASPARAQSLYLHAATLTADAEHVADLVGPVDGVFRDATHVQVQYTSRDVTLAGEVDLLDPDDFLAAGVGRDVPLEGTGVWSISLRAQTWVPVAGDSPSGVVVALPASMPVRRATIPRGTPGAHGRPSGAEVWDGPGRDTTPAEADPLARYVSLRATRGPGSPMWASPPGASVRVVGRAGRDRVVEIAFHGIVVRGFVERRQPLFNTPHDVGAMNRARRISLVGVVEPLRGRAVSLAAGTLLYATAGSTTAFGTLRATVLGLEPTSRIPVTSCTAGPPVVCERDPPEPRGPARWVIQLPDAQITAWVRTPAEQLPNGVLTREMSFAAMRRQPLGPDHWPRPARPAPPTTR